MTVLVAEDNPINREVVRRQLELLRIDVTMAENGKEALLALQQRSFDLVFMDLHMPELDGRDTTREARKNGYKGPIVAMTASALPEDRESAREAGMDQFLTKPVTMEALSSLFAAPPEVPQSEVSRG